MMPEVAMSWPELRASNAITWGLSSIKRGGGRQKSIIFPRVTQERDSQREM